jgi:hypothetical protein
LEGWHTILAALGVSALCGTAAQLRTEGDLRLRDLFAATLYSGCLGLVIALLWFNYFHPTNRFFLIGIAGLSGLGGMSVADFAIKLISKGTGVAIHISSGPGHKGASEQLDDHDH